jgi:hypothetical protein
MKKVIVACFSIIIAVSFSAVVLAANNVNKSSVKIAKLLVLSEDEPAPVPEPAPEPPTPAPEPVPAPEPE